MSDSRSHDFDCLEREDFSDLTVGKLAEAAQINRSTFYRHFEDKYQLRDYVTDSVVSGFVENLEVDYEQHLYQYYDEPEDSEVEDEDE